MIECFECKKKNPEESNFCSRCGISLNKKSKCPICLENKENVILMCGHLVCKSCIDRTFEIKNECPICRAEIFKCPKSGCTSYRVLNTELKRECLDCGHITKIIPKKQKKITCIDCKSGRILFNNDLNNWSCLDCFCIFKINNELASFDSIASTTKICSLCCSNDIEYKDNEVKCLNCEQTNIKLKHITLEEYSHLNIKSKSEVLKKMEKMFECLQCKSNKICKLVNLNDPIEELYFCKSCNTTSNKIKINT